MQLIYRAQTLGFTARLAQTTSKPLAVNWRYQLLGETYGATPTAVQVYKTPKVVNWRWQVK